MASNDRPDVTDEDIGMRAFQLRKDKAVERAIERLRGGLRTSWSMFSQRDLNDLSWMIGELWAYENRAEWDNLHFSKLTAEDVLLIITVARDLRIAPHNTVEMLEKIRELVMARSV